MALVYEVARQDAEQVSADYWLPDKYPVDVENIASQMDIRVERTFLQEGVSGMIRARPDDVTTIYVEASDSPTRQRFTIAHELGHYVERFNQGQLDFAFIDKRGMKYDLHEFYADEFAGSLLMPQETIEMLRNRGFSNLGIAKYFDVSPAALAKRLERLKKTNATEF